MKPVSKLTYSLGLFLMLSLLLHLATWGALSGAGIALLTGFGSLAQEEVISVLIAEPPPDRQPPTVSTPVNGKAARKAVAAPAPAAAPASPPEATGVTQTDTLPVAEGASGPAAAHHAVTAAAGPAFPNVSTAAVAVPLPTPVIVAKTSPPAPPFSAVPTFLPAPIAPLAPYSTVAVTPTTGMAPPSAPVAVAPAAPPVPDIVPFVRERLTFSLYWSGFHVGTAVIEAVRENGTVSITSTVRSNAVISAFYKVEDRAETRLVNGRPVSFTLLQHEGTHSGNKETIFDRERDKVIYINHKDKSRTEYEMGGKVLWDVISAFYYLRRQPLEIGTPVHISMFDSNKFVNTEVRVLRRETTEQDDGREEPSIVVEPVLMTEGLFKKSGEIFIWLTDDERRLPVRMETKLKIGSVTAELKSYSVEKK